MTYADGSRGEPITIEDIAIFRYVWSLKPERRRKLTSIFTLKISIYEFLRAVNTEDADVNIFHCGKTDYEVCYIKTGLGQISELNFADDLLIQFRRGLDKVINGVTKSTFAVALVMIPSSKIGDDTKRFVKEFRPPEHWYDSHFTIDESIE